MKARTLALINYAAWSAAAEYGQLDPNGLMEQLTEAAKHQRMEIAIGRRECFIIDRNSGQVDTITRAALWVKAKEIAT